MTLAIDASSPITATNPTAGIQVVTSASFTPPASSLLVVLWAADEQAGGGSATPTITDSRGVPLTYTLRQWKANGQGAPALNGQAAIWTAPVTSSAAMTVTVTGASLGTFGESGLRVRVLTDSGTTPTVGTSSLGGQSSGTAVPMAYTATQTGSWGFAAVCDWDVVGLETAGAGTTLIDSASPGTAITYGFFQRTTADGVSASATTINGTLPSASTNLAWAAVEIKGAAAGGTAAPPARPASPGRTWRRKFKHRQTPRPDDFVGAVAPSAPVFVPSADRRPFYPVAVRRVRSSSSPVYVQDVPPTSPRRGRDLAAVLRRGRTVSVVPTQAVITAPDTLPVALRAGRDLAALLRRGRTSSVTPDQVVVTATAAPSVALRAGRDLAALLRRGRTSSVAPAQDDVLSSTRRASRFAAVARRGRTSSVTPAQDDAPSSTRRASRVALARRGRTSSVTPAQVVTTAPATPSVAMRAGRDLAALLRRGRTASVTPAQIVVLAPPTLPAALRAGRRLGGLLRRGRTVSVTPAQVVVLAPATVPTALRGGRRLAALARRGRTSSTTPTQGAPLAPKAPREPRLAARRRVSAGPPAPQAAPPQAKPRAARRALLKGARRRLMTAFGQAVAVTAQRGTANPTARTTSGAAELDHSAATAKSTARVTSSAAELDHSVGTARPASRSEPTAGA